ncbi:early endosome antigen 1-like [Clytia hemisphaerica]
METISPDHQVIVSTPPPLTTPFNLSINSNTHQHILPPIKSLPSWNRHRIGLAKPCNPIISKNIENFNTGSIRSVPLTKQSVLSEQCTQTSAQSSRQSSSSSLSSSKQTPPRTSGSSRKHDLKSLYDKKIVFLQTSHGEVLGDLQEEVDQLKLENKGLQFNLVMTRGNLDKLSKSLSNSPHGSSTNSDNNELKLMRKVKSLEKELHNVKTELNSARDQNKELMELVQQSQNHEIRPKSSIKFNNKKTLKKSATTSRLPANYHKKISPRASYQTFENDSKENEVGCLSDRCNQNTNFTLPIIHSNRRKLSGRNNNNKKSRDTDEPITLPILQPFPHPNNNYSLRCKRTKAVQMQNKRPQKDLSLSLLSKQNFMTQ